MKARIISAVIALVIGLTLLIMGGRVLAVGIFLFAVIALYEFYSAFETAGFKPVKSVGFLYLLVLVYAIVYTIEEPMAIYIKGLTNINLFPLLQTIIMLLLLALIVIKHRKYNVKDAAVTMFGGYFVVILLSYFLLLRNMEQGAYLLFLALLGSVMADTCAFWAGRLLGKKKLIPEVSPKKTVAGSIGAVVGSLFFMVLYGVILIYAGYYTKLPLWHYAVLGLITGVTAQFGDLAASAMKRTVGIKDFGKLLPGHGGILDRFDSYLFVFPIVYYYLLFVL